MTKPANALRGEAEITIADQPYLLRPSFENLVAAEDDLGSLFAMVERASQGAITLSEITSLLWHCLDADPRPDKEIVGNAVLQIGLVAATKPVRTILGEVLQGKM